jgi:hypothetical protein
MRMRRPRRRRTPRERRRGESAAAGNSGRGALEEPGAAVVAPCPSSGAHRRGYGGAQALKIAERHRPAKKPPGLATPGV